MKMKKLLAFCAAGIMVIASSVPVYAMGTGNRNLGTASIQMNGIARDTVEDLITVPRIVGIIPPPVTIEPPPPPVIGTGLSPIIYLLESDRFKEWVNKKAEEEGREIPYPEVREDEEDTPEEKEESSSNLEEFGEDSEGLPQWLRDFASFTRKYMNPIIMV